MANWRARMKLPEAADKAIRTKAAQDEVKLKTFVEGLMSEGLDRLVEAGADHDFEIDGLIQSNGGLPVVEYVIDDGLRRRVEPAAPLASGRGKQGKVMAEALLLALKSRGIYG
ncbi:MAG: hypothetical protein AAFW46_09580 [Pseudomonadota bacterium]